MTNKQDPLVVGSHEFGTVRVLTTALDPEDASAITAQNVHRLLGDGVTLDADKVEVVPTRALEGLGLSAYLREGYGVADKDLDGRRAQLDAVSGLVVLIPASAFAGREQTLDPHPSMRFLGVFHEQAAAPTSQMSRPESAKGTVAATSGKAPKPGDRRRKGSWIIALGALIIAATLILLVVA